MAQETLTRAVMLDRFLAADSTFNGRFVAGIRTTGIYCLPSCSARKALPQNIRFFTDETKAQRAGLRACRRCKPDDFYAKRNPDVEVLQTLFAEVQESVARFATADDLIARSGFGSSKFSELVRLHWHSTPAALLRQWKVRSAARRLVLEPRRSVADIAFESGFESISTFNENFRRLMALPPTDYRRLRDANEFALELPADHRPGDVIAMATRLDAVADDTIVRALHIGDTPVVLRIQLRAGRALCRIIADRAASPEAMILLHDAALRMLGLHSDPDPFEQWALRNGHGRLIDGGRGLRLIRSATPFEGIAWAIVGQQVNVTFASALQQELIEACGVRGPDGVLVYPTAEQVARLDASDLTTRRFSRSKADYLLGVARAVASGELDLEALPQLGATAARERLLELRGIGIWSANYIMMRVFGFEDCAPLGDTGLSTGLQRYLRLDERPDAAACDRLMQRFAPYRTWATFHLWRHASQKEKNA